MKKFFVIVCVLLAVVMLFSVVESLYFSTDEKNHVHKNPGGGSDDDHNNNGGIDDWEPVYDTICPYCDRVYDIREYSSCPNTDCPSYDGEVNEPDGDWQICPECGSIMGEASGCPDPDCVSNGGNIGQVVCPECGESYNLDTDQSCPNVNCPSHSTGENWQTCPDCGSMLGEASRCPNPDCVSNGSNNGQVVCPECGESYNSDSDQSCPNVNCPLYSSGDHSNSQTCSVCGMPVGEASSCSNEECPSNQTICDLCGGVFNLVTGYCDNMNCSNSPANDPNNIITCPACGTTYNPFVTDGRCPGCPNNPYGTCSSCDSPLREGGTCTNDACPNYHSL